MPDIAGMDEDRDIVGRVTRVQTDEGHEIVPCETRETLRARES
jgi:hypothetical protein